MLLAWWCPPSPPVANRVDLPVSSPVEFWVAVPSSLQSLLTECIQISLSNIRSSYVKNKSKQTSKGRRDAARRDFSQCSQPTPSSDSVVALIIVFNPSSPPPPPPPGSQRPPAPPKWVQPFGANPDPKPGL